MKLRAEDFLNTTVDAATTDLRALLGEAKADELIVTVFEDRQELAAKRLGLCLLVDEVGKVYAAHCHADGQDGYAVYQGSLPHKLKLTMPRSAVQALLGKPAMRGGGQDVPLLGKQPRWDRYHLDGYALTLCYTADDTAIAQLHFVRHERPGK